MQRILPSSAKASKAAIKSQATKHFQRQAELSRLRKGTKAEAESEE